MAIEAPLCMQEGCNNPTWDVLCYQHVDGPKVQRPSATRIKSPYKPIHDNEFPTHSSLANLWENANKVFPDLADVVHPESLRTQAVETIRSAVSNETYRLFPLIDVPDFQDREQRVHAARQYFRDELSLIPLSISDSEAYEIANSSSDQYGRAIDDSGALASYAIRLEWETANVLQVEKSSDGIPYSIPFKDFCEATAQSFDEKIDTEYRKSLSGFEGFIMENFGRPPLNIGDMATDIKLPEDQEPWNANPVLEERAIMNHHTGIIKDREQAHEAALAEQRARDEKREARVEAGWAFGKALLDIVRGGSTPEERWNNKKEAEAQRRRESDHWDQQDRARISTEAAKEQREFYRRANGKKW